jgi:hypothetical protein
MRQLIINRGRLDFKKYYLRNCFTCDDSPLSTIKLNITTKFLPFNNLNKKNQNKYGDINGTHSSNR